MASITTRTITLVYMIVAVIFSITSAALSGYHFKNAADHQVRAFLAFLIIGLAAALISVTVLIVTEIMSNENSKQGILKIITLICLIIAAVSFLVALGVATHTASSLEFAINMCIVSCVSTVFGLFLFLIFWRK